MQRGVQRAQIRELGGETMSGTPARVSLQLFLGHSVKPLG